MNRKERRNLKNDKNLVKELYSIIVKYLPELLTMFDNLTNVRPYMHFPALHPLRPVRSLHR